MATRTTEAQHTRPWTPEESKLLGSWGRYAAAAQHGHYLLSTRLRRANLWIGIPTVVTSAIVGTSLFASLANAEGGAIPAGVRVTIGLLSLLAAVLAALQTFLRFPQRAERHAQAGDWYAAIKRKIDELSALPSDERGAARDVLDGVRGDMNKAGQSYPEIGEVVWHTVAELYGVPEPAFEQEVRARKR